MKANELIKEMSKKRRKTIFGKQIPITKDGDDMFITFDSNIEYSYSYFIGSIRYKIKDILKKNKVVNFYLRKDI